jgi:hypothetical protein
VASIVTEGRRGERKVSRVYVIGKGRCGRTLFVLAEDRLLHDVLLPRVVDDANVYTGKQQQEQNRELIHDDDDDDDEKQSQIG